MEEPNEPRTRTVAHVSNTNVRQDHRVQKAMLFGTQAGYSVEALGFTPEKIGWAAGAIDAGERADIQTVPLIFGRSSGTLRTLALVLQILEMNVKVVFHLLRIRPDVLHCHGFAPLPGAVLSKVFLNCALVYDAHELESSRDGLSRIESKTVALLEKALWSRVDGLIVVSPSIGSWYREKLGPKPSRLVLNSPVFELPEGGDKSPARPTVYNKVFKAGYVGAFTAGRSVVEFASSVSKVKGNFSITFVGDGPLRGRLEEISKLDPRIEVLHSVPQNELGPLISSFDLGLCLIENTSLSNYYAIPNKLLEYLEMGVPVLASDFPDIQWVLSYGAYGVVANPSEVGNAIEIFESFLDGADLPRPILDESLRWPCQAARVQELYAAVLEVRT